MIFLHGSERNKFGYYQVGEKFCTYSWAEALEEQQRTGQKLDWIFNDHFFSLIDWTQEPTETLEQLYAERARQLREKYDYIVLEFSGGSDSHNVLNAFIQNNIHLDEVLTVHSHDISNVSRNSRVDLSTEIFNAAIPEAQQLLELAPNTVYRVVDLSNDIKQTLLDIKNTSLKFDIIYKYNGYFGPFAIAHAEFKENFPHYKNLIDQGKRVCFLYGVDKPNLSYVNKQWSFCFNNTFDTYAPVMYQQSLMSTEVFYWAPEAWKIIAKQAHSIRRHIRENATVLKNLKRSADITDPGYYSTLGILDKPIPVSMIKKAIYPWWRDNIVDCGKMTVRSPLGSLNNWFVTNINSTPGGKELYGAVDHLLQKSGYNGQVSAYTKPPISSKSYYF